MTSTAPWPNNRLAIERLYKIHQTLSSGARRSSAELAAELEVSQRTIQRDLEFLGTRFMAKIERDSSTKKYYYAEPFELPPMNLTAGEMVVFFLGEKLLQQCAGTPFEEQIRTAMEKIEVLLPEEIKLDAELLQTKISFSVPQLNTEAEIMAQYYSIILEAIQNQHVLGLRHTSFFKSHPESREVEPYHVVHIEGMWYLVAYCRLRHEFRTFAMARIQELRLLDKQFSPQPFNINSYLKYAWLIERGKKYDVELLFSAKQAPWIKERLWHPQQVLQEADDGKLYYKVRVTGLGEIKRWVLQYGAEVEVLKPLELRASIMREVEEMQNMYS